MDTTASENPAAIPTMEERLNAAREAYMDAISTAIDEQVESFILPGDKVALLADAAAFMGYILTVKTVEALRLAPTKKTLIRTWNQLSKRANQEVPSALLGFANARAAETGGDANA